MLRAYVKVKDRLAHLRRDESGQDAFEYLLVIGAIMVAVVVAVAAGGSGPVTSVWNAVSARVVDATNGVIGS